MLHLRSILSRMALGVGHIDFMDQACQQEDPSVVSIERDELRERTGVNDL